MEALDVKSCGIAALDLARVQLMKRSVQLGARSCQEPPTQMVMYLIDEESLEQENGFRRRLARIYRINSSRIQPLYLNPFEQDSTAVHSSYTTNIDHEQ